MALGVYVSRCAGRVDAALDVRDALDGVASRPAVTRVFDDLFDVGVADSIAADVSAHGLDAVVLA